MILLILLLNFCFGVNAQNVVNEAGNNTEWEQYLKANEIKEGPVTPTLNFSTKCFEDLGCYNNGPPFFHPVFRPVSYLPLDNPDENIKFLLYTPENQFNSYILSKNEQSLKNSPFNESATTAVYIHGWHLYLPPDNPLFTLKDLLISKRGYNFILVEWTNYTGDSLEQAVANGRVVGTAAAKLIHFLVNYTSLTLDNVHVIGLSTGCQITGYVGQETPGLGRISGFDCQHPLFGTNNIDVRLDASDAKFVDTIHTNGGRNLYDGMGDMLPYGDEDFFPGGGQDQPDCGHDDPKNKKAFENDAIKRKIMLNCAHIRSQNYFIESISNPNNCTFMGTLCQSYEDWKEGNCKPSEEHPVAVMGIDAKPIPGLHREAKFYLDTNLEPPYCKEDGYKNPTFTNAEL